MPTKPAVPVRVPRSMALGPSTPTTLQSDTLSRRTYWTMQIDYDGVLRIWVWVDGNLDAVPVSPISTLLMISHSARAMSYAVPPGWLGNGTVDPEIFSSPSAPGQHGPEGQSFLLLLEAAVSAWGREVTVFRLGNVPTRTDTSNPRTNDEPSDISIINFLSLFLIRYLGGVLPISQTTTSQHAGVSESSDPPTGELGNWEYLLLTSVNI
ncbi:hypothetical protein BGW80DRAFT_1253716 [Lactifluus volemus]|nr:hypothetical protein BGW80DRAFT_1253716 [Lactifluus volemus]